MITLTYPSNLPSELQGVQVVDVRELLPVNKNYTWAQLKGIRPITDLTTIVFHHDGMAKSKSAHISDIQFISNIAMAHINSKVNNKLGDPGCPYDVMVRNGIIYITNYIEPLEYGVASNNKYTVNVCVCGDYANYDTLTDADRKALYVVYFMLRPVLPSYKASLGHGQITPTKCPGYDMNKVRSDLMDIEQKMLYQQSAAYSKDIAHRIAQQNTYLYNLSLGKNPNGTPCTSGQTAWAVAMLMKLYPFMQENKLFG